MKIEYDRRVDAAYFSSSAAARRSSMDLAEESLSR
jgi:uncharacterized protein YuzE